MTGLLVERGRPRSPLSRSFGSRGASLPARPLAATWPPGASANVAEGKRPVPNRPMVPSRRDLTGGGGGNARQLRHSLFSMSGFFVEQRKKHDRCGAWKSEEKGSRG